MRINKIACTVTILVNLLGPISIDIEPVRASPQQCYQAALPYPANSYTADLVAWMCQGVESSTPAECFKTALPYPHNDVVVKRAAMLCKGAKSIDPGKCFQEAIGYPYSDVSVERAYTLCKTPEPTRDDRGESERHHRDREEPHGAWQLTSKNWTGILRMRGHHGTLVLVYTPNGEIIEEKMELEKSREYGYILTGSIVTATSKSRSSDTLYISQFSKEPIKIKGCDAKGCYDMTLTYLGK